MLILLIILLLILLWVAYQISHGELCSPAFLYVAPFILMCVVAFGFREEWGFDLHINTFFVILVGVTSFIFGTYFADKIRDIKFIKVGSNCELTDTHSVSTWKYVFFIALQLVCYVMRARYVMRWAASYGAGSNLSEAIAYYNEVRKFTTDDLVSFPTWLSWGIVICTMYGILIACCLAQQVLLVREKKNKNLILILISFVVAVIGEALSGGRGGSVQLMIGFIAAFMILYYRRYNWRKKIPFKFIIRIALGLIAIVLLFCATITLFGRNEIHMFGRYLSSYCGAQIFNLDYFLNSNFESSVIFGQETFYPLVQRFAKILGITEWSNYHVGYDSVYAAGYSTGNVYTAFFTYIMDFGYLGAVILPFLFGIFSQIIYKHARKSPTNTPINLGLVFYSNLAYMIAFSFFADKFGSLVFTFNMVKKLIVLWLIMVFMYRFEIKGYKIVIKSNRIPLPARRG